MNGVVPDAHVGCYIFVPPMSLPSWCLGVVCEGCQDDDKDDNDDDNNPLDLSLNSDNGVLSVLNPSEVSKSYFVSVENCKKVIGADGVDMLRHHATYVTFIVLAAPRTQINLCTLLPKKRGRYSSIVLTADIQTFSLFVPAAVPTSRVVDFTTFPLSGDSGPWLCTQSEGGLFTHFALCSRERKWNVREHRRPRRSRTAHM